MRIARVSIARVPYEAEKAPPKRGCQVGGNAVPKGDQHWLAESSKGVQIDFAYIPILSARSSRPLGNGQENGFAGSRTAAQTLSIFSIYEANRRGGAHKTLDASSAPDARAAAVRSVRFARRYRTAHRLKHLHRADGDTLHVGATGKDQSRIKFGGRAAQAADHTDLSADTDCAE